ncbi:hypothetical protein AwWohl_14220 [Gammaproteobacteria bacterium]|nr:hypothetical protein AwWohl_14220 [Gammaproteobacteria bacterium]
MSGEQKPKLLKTIQAEIFALRAPSDTPVFTLLDNDNSILIHHGYSPLRELETLYDQLLDFLNNDQNLELNDILVMVPQIDLYEPFIHAVFGNTPAARSLKYSLSDQHLVKTDPLYTCVIKLLNLNQAEFKAEQIASLLHIPEISTNFDIDPDQIATLLSWIEGSGIRFGRDSKHIQSLGGAANDINTFSWGIKRMLLGAVSIDEQHPFEEITPFMPTRGISAQLAGKFAMFIDALCAWSDSLNEPRYLVDLSNLLSTLESCFFTHSDDSQKKFKQLHQSWQELIQSGLKSNYQSLLSIQTIAKLFEDILDKNIPSQNFLMGKINFCTLMPMRAIPFKVIAILGLNQNDFPKATTHDSFDLIANNPRYGDRNSNIDDRYLFLEALLSAQNNLYLSFIGHSITDNSTTLPSVLIDELTDYVDKIRRTKELDLPASKQCLSIHSPLMPFSESLFIEPKLPFELRKTPHSYRAQWITANYKHDYDDDHAYNAAFSYPKILIEKLNIDGLIKFYKDPLGFFCNKHYSLNFYTNIDFPILPSVESFGDLNNLDNYSFNENFIQDNLDKLVQNQDEKPLLQAYYKSLGILPKFDYETIYWKEKQALFQDLIDAIAQYSAPEYIKQAPKNILIKLESNQQQQISLTGSLPVLQQHVAAPTATCIFWSSAKGKLKRLISAYIYHLCHCVNRAKNEPSITTIHYSINSGKLIKHNFSAITQAEAKYQLDIYLHGFEYGISAPILWLRDDFESNIKEDKVMKILDEILEQINIDHPEFTQTKPWDLIPANFLSANSSLANLLEEQLCPIFEDYSDPALLRLFAQITSDDLLKFVLNYHWFIKPIYNALTIE